MSRKSNSFYGSREYIGKSAKTKMSYLWNEIRADGNPASFPWKIEMGKIFAQCMDTVFKQAGDAMKPGYFWGSREKMIHTVGNTGKVRFIPSNPSHFTGIFEGANYGIIRLSSAAKPEKGG